MLTEESVLEALQTAKDGDTVFVKGGLHAAGRRNRKHPAARGVRRALGHHNRILPGQVGPRGHRSGCSGATTQDEDDQGEGKQAGERKRAGAKAINWH